ncbi:peptidoglycan recognition protein family protein [Xylocopilactobacillus apicola]|uniref:N-acetylmuramoyl-L-alanine amidase domain-containing protein n=1 Tax=Xylocopilactobacillus apicola TaxID=2932184 RepID=A0AAU9DAD0_9LACO|nr:peptidoglycan recognition family protein [Xylocopilactobacillus apicola]BDR57797.1 hypothetical protein XA3_02380 [Xylocopilactobacillus apicola]
MHKKTIAKIAGVLVALCFLAVSVIPLTQNRQPVVTKAYADVNTYILQNNFPNPNIQTRKTPFWGVGAAYRNGVGRPEGIVVHETANNNDAIENEIAYESNNWNVPGRESYVHAFVDRSQIINTASTDLTCWGAGPVANARYISIELCREKTFDNFARSVNNDAYYVAYLLKKYNLPVTNATHTGSGTVWSHHAVSNFLGGTNHTDPTGYFSSWGYSMDQFFQLVQYKYNNLGVEPAEKVASKANISESEVVSGKASNQPFYYLTDAGIVKGGSANQFIGNTYQATSIVKTKNNGIYTLLTNGGAPLAWVRTGQLSLGGNDPIASQISVKNIAYLTDNSPLYYSLGNGFQANDISGPYSYSIKSVAKTESGRIFYLLVDNWTAEPFMWVENKNASLKDSLGSEIVSTIKGSPALPDKKGSKLPAAVSVLQAAPTSWLLEDGLHPTNDTTRVGTQVYVLGNRDINQINYTSVSVDGFDSIGYVPTSTLKYQTENLTSIISKQSGNGIVNNAAGAQVYSWPGGTPISGSILPQGSAWKFTTVVTTTDNVEWYQVGGYQWIKGSNINIQY